LRSHSFSWQLSGKEKKEGLREYTEVIWQVKIKNTSSDTRQLRPTFRIRNEKDLVIAEDRLDVELAIQPQEDRAIERAIWIVKPESNSTLRGELNFEIRPLPQEQRAQEQPQSLRIELPGRTEIDLREY
jgi:hypothetical protein